MATVSYGLQMNAISSTSSLSVFAKYQGRSVSVGLISVCVENSEPHWSPVHINALVSKNTTPGASKAERDITA